jgi:hypothetical protein
MTAIDMARRLTAKQRRLVLALPTKGMKKWRAQYRHAKVRGWTSLPFAVARPSLDGRELLTDFGREVKTVLMRGTVRVNDPRQPMNWITGETE